MLPESTRDSTNTMVPALMNEAGEESHHLDNTPMSVSALSLRLQDTQLSNKLEEDFQKLYHK